MSYQYAEGGDKNLSLQVDAKIMLHLIFERDCKIKFHPRDVDEHR